MNLWRKLQTDYLAPQNREGDGASKEKTGAAPKEVKEQIKKMRRRLVDAVDEDTHIDPTRIAEIIEQLACVAGDGNQRAAVKAVPEVFDVIRNKKFSNEQEVQVQGCHYFWAIAYMDIDRVFTKGVDKVIAAINISMRTHKASDNMLRNAFGALANLAVNSAYNKEAILAKDDGAFIWDTVVKKSKPSGTKTSDASTAVLEVGLGLLKNLANQAEGLEDVRFVVTDGRAAKIGKIMERNSGNVIVQYYGCGLLQHLAATSRGSFNQGAETNAKDSIQAAMQKHSRDDEVQQEAIRSLCSLVAKSEDPRSFAAFVGPIINAMKIHQKDVGVQTFGCGFLMMLASDQHGQAKVIKGGGVGAVVMTMKYIKEDAVCQRNACGALTNLSAGSEVNKSAILNAGAVLLVAEGMTIHFPDDVRVQRESCGLFANLAMATELVRKRMRQEGAIEALEVAQNNHKGDNGVQELSRAAQAFLEDDFLNDRTDDFNGYDEYKLDADKQEGKRKKKGKKRNKKEEKRRKESILE